MKTIKVKDYYGHYVEVSVTDEFANEWRLMENETQRVYRKEVYHRSSIPLDDLDLFSGSECEPETALLHRERMEQIYAAFEKLTPVMQKRLLRYAETRNFAKISREEHCAAASVKKSVYAAIRNIRTLIGE